MHLFWKVVPPSRHDGLHCHCSVGYRIPNSTEIPSFLSASRCLITESSGSSSWSPASAMSTSKLRGYCKCAGLTRHRKMVRNISLLLVHSAKFLQNWIWQCSGPWVLTFGPSKQDNLPYLVHHKLYTMLYTFIYIMIYTTPCAAYSAGCCGPSRSSTRRTVLFCQAYWTLRAPEAQRRVSGKLWLTHCRRQIWCLTVPVAEEEASGDASSNGKVRLRTDRTELLESRK